MRKLRVYVDTSVIGGCLDEEFADASNALISMAIRGEVTFLISPLLLDELRGAPEQVQGILTKLPPGSIEEVDFNEDARLLRDAYLRAEVLGPAWSDDAHHVALATVSRADMIASWNFRHIVHFDKMRGFNAVNLREGYPPLEIHSPREIV